MLTAQTIHRLTLPLKQLVMRFACHDFVGRCISRQFNDRIPNRGSIIDTSSPWVVPSMKAALFWGSYEKSEVLLVQRYLGRDLNVIEMGSSIGVVASHIAKKLDERLSLVSVEANPHLIDTIKRNVAQNQANIDFTVVNAAVDYSGNPTMALAIADRNIDSRIVDAPQAGSVSVPTTSLSEIHQSIGGQAFRLVADIEGAEWAMIKNDAEALGACKQMIIELHHATDRTARITPNEMAEQIIELGFEQVARRGDVFVFVRP